MAYRIKHKPTGRYLKMISGTAMWFSVVNCLEGNIEMGTTNKTGKIYATKSGAEKASRRLFRHQPNDWELEEL